MSGRDENQIYLLANGKHNYFDLFLWILRWVDNTDEPTYEEMRRTVMSEPYKVSPDVFNYVWRIIDWLNWIGPLRAKILCVSSRDGKDLLRLQDRTNQMLLLSVFLLNKDPALDAVLRQHVIGLQPLTLTDLMSAIRVRFPNIPEQEVIQHRDWWTSIDCLRQVNETSFKSTRTGIQYAFQFRSTQFSSVIDEVGVEALKQLFNPPYSASYPKEWKSVAVQTDDDIVDALIKELNEATTDSESFRRLEWAVSDAFKFLGFKVTHLGTPGDTDNILQADIGTGSYRVIVDAKTSANGIIYTLDTQTLKRHRKKHKADYIVVVAPDFSQEPTSKAENNHIVLLSVEVLIDWLKLHAQTPLNLAEYGLVFEQWGYPKQLPTEIVFKSQKFAQLTNLLHDILTALETMYEKGIYLDLTNDQMHLLVSQHLGEVVYSIEEINLVLGLLTNPIISGLTADNGRISMRTSRKTFSRKLKHLIKAIDVDSVL